MKDIKQIAAWMNAEVEMEQKNAIEQSAKRMDWTTAAAVSGTAAAGAVMATKERSGKMAAIGGATGLIAWLLYDHFRQPAAPDTSPVKYSTGNWATDRQIAQNTLESNYLRKLQTAGTLLSRLDPEMRAKIFEHLKLFAVKEADKMVLQQQPQHIGAAIELATPASRTALLEFARQQAAIPAPSSSGPGDSVATGQYRPPPPAVSTGPGDAVYEPMKIPEPTIESNVVRSGADQLNQQIRRDPEVSKTDQPLIIQTDQAKIDAIAREIKKKHPEYDDKEIGDLATRIAYNNARRAYSGEPANWLNLLVNHGFLVKQVSLQWLMWKDLLSPLDLEEGATQWYKMRAEPPPPLCDVGIKDEAGAYKIGGFGYGWHGTGIEKATTSPFMAPPNPSPSGSYGERLAWEYLQYENLVPWSCRRNAFTHIGVRPRELVLNFMNGSTNGTIRDWYMGRRKGYRSFDRWGFDKFPRVVHPGSVVKVPAWWKDEQRKHPDEAVWTDAFYLNRVRDYYNTSHWLVWAGIVYCMHAHKSIPSWYRKHALYHGVPCPSRRQEVEGRNFATCSTADVKDLEEQAAAYRKQTGVKLPLEAFCPLRDWKKMRPIPIGIDGSGAGSEIPRSKVEEMLSLVVKHTPLPGSMTVGKTDAGDEIRKYERRLADWPAGSTGPYRPDLTLPTWWGQYMREHETKQQRKENKRERIGMKIYMGAFSAIAGLVGSGVANTLTSTVTTQVTSALARSVLTEVIKAGVNSILTTLGDVQMAALEGGGLRIDRVFFKQVVSVATAAAGPLLGTTLDKAGAQLQEAISKIEGSIDSIAGQAWQHTWALLGDVSDNYHLIMKDAISGVDGFLEGKGNIGGVLNGIADPSVAALVTKYTDIPETYLSMGYDEIMNRAEGFADDLNLEAKLGGNIKKKINDWKTEAAEIEGAAKIIMDF